MKTLYLAGALVAAGVSYAKWKSVGWAITHGMLSWIYVVHLLEVRYNLF